MSDHRLVLYPTDIEVAVDKDSLLQVLHDTGLVGDDHDWQGEKHFLPGERFLEQVIFLGCSPYINLAPPQDDAQGSEYCHIGLPGNCDTAEFIGGDNVRTPRCPFCKQPLENWRDGVASKDNFHCQQCGEKLSLAELNWRRSAAYARCSVHIWGVHDGEAVPSELLMTALSKLTGCKWAYFYRQSS